MIANLVLLLFYALIFLLTYPLRFFGDVSLSNTLTSSIASANTYFSFGYRLLPYTVSAILFTWGIYIVIEIAIFIYKGIKWIYSKIPGIS